MNIRTKSCCCSANKQKSIYDFEIMAMGGKSVSLADYKGKVLLIVNTASKCGFTPQMEELSEHFLPEKEHRTLNLSMEHLLAK